MDWNIKKENEMSLPETVTIDNPTASGRIFPLQGTMLSELINNPEFKQSFHARLQASNRFFVFFYKIYLLPLMGMGRQIMVLSTIGRTSHKRRDFPIGYYRIDGVVHVLSGWGKGANWYKNIITNPKEVYLQIGFRRFHATPEVIEDPAELHRTIERFIICCPKGAQQLIGWDPQHDSLETADFSMMMDKVLVVKFLAL
jgi:deazaflavin-dependent oxidoreductase (nitroreductase family)